MIYLVWLVIGLVWGTTWGVIRIGLTDLPPLTFAALRTGLAALALVSVAQVVDRARRPTGADLRFWLVMGIPQLGIPYALIFWAEQTITSSLTAILFATFPAFTALAAHFLLHDERLTVGRVAGTAMAMLAVIVIVGPAVSLGTPAAVPIAAVLIASVSGAVGAVLVRRHGQRTSTLWLTAIQVASGALFLCGLALFLEWDRPVVFTITSTASIAYLAFVVTVGCYLGLFWLLKRLNATFVSLGVVLETAVAVILGGMALGEPVGLRMFVGLGLVGVSVVLVNWRPAERRTS